LFYFYFLLKYKKDEKKMKFENFIKLGMATLAVVVPTTLYVANYAATDYLKAHPYQSSHQEEIQTQGGKGISISANQAKNQDTNYLLDDVESYQVGSIKAKREILKVSDNNNNNKSNNYFRLK
jgi:hypothetical protein